MRLPQLDVLRAVAVLLVLGRHLPFVEGEFPSYVAPLLNYWKNIGWLGVDLFFVLSGFLVSGLLFREYQRYGWIDVKRFLIRRGFKIYPPFYFFLIVCLPLSAYLGNTCSWRQIASECLFVQNYLSGVFEHTWSLAVEEHFYLLLAALFGWLVYANRLNPFKSLPTLFLVISIIILGIRCIHSHLTTYKFRTHMEPTHLRVDSLFFGVLLAYWYRFSPNRIQLCKKYPFLALSVSALLLLPVLVLNISNFFCHTIGLSLAYLAFGILLLVGVTSSLPQGFLPRSLLRLLATIGANSYSIYLWHMAVRKGVTSLAALVFPNLGSSLLIVICYVLASVAFGTVMAKCLERPTMALRDRLFPSLLGAGDSPATPSAPSIQKDDSNYVLGSKPGELPWKPTCK